LLGSCRNAAALLIALVTLVWSVCTMSRYGITYDEPGLLYAGDRTLYYLEHPGVRSALDLTGDDPDGFHSDFARFPDWNDPIHYPVLPGLVCAVTSTIVHDQLRWLDSIDGHHLGLLLLNALALYLFCRYATRVVGTQAGILATVLLATFPAAVGHSINDVKDWPSAQFYGLTVLAAAAGILERRAVDLLAAGLWLGAALSCMANGVFALVTILVWTPVAYAALYWRHRKVTAPVVAAYLVVPYLAAAFFFWAWPWLHYGPISECWRRLSAHVIFMLDRGVSDRSEWSAYPLRCLTFMSPPLVLAAGAVGTLAVVRPGTRERFAVRALLILWMALPIVRCAAPHANFYDANRHFIEYVPALCALAGAGLSDVLSGLAPLLAALPRGARGAIAACATVGFAVCLGWPIAEYHPYEVTYFNGLAGGLGGAQRSGLLQAGKALWRANGAEGDYWYTSLRDAVAVLRRRLGPGDVVGFCGPQIAQVEANWQTNDRPKLTRPPSDDARFVYVAARESSCGWKTIHELERARPVEVRAERGGGLVWELLGPLDGQAHEPPSPTTVYDFP
jgi:hypothetical protein